MRLIVRYFLRLAEEFEVQMQTYRQQILEMEHHLASADQSSALSPQGCASGSTLCCLFACYV